MLRGRYVELDGEDAGSGCGCGDRCGVLWSGVVVFLIPVCVCRDVCEQCLCVCVRGVRGGDLGVLWWGGRGESVCVMLWSVMEVAGSEKGVVRNVGCGGFVMW